tara:strand:- start:134 stop:1048 length:915 start_codon:yes stop_codon:yes gene_type:complete
MISNQLTVWSENLALVQGFLTHLVDSGRKIYIEVEEIPIQKNHSGFIFTYQTINILASEEDFTAEDLEMANNYSGMGKEEPQDDKGFFTCGVELYQYLSNVACAMRKYGWYKSKNVEEVTPTFLEALHNMEYERTKATNVIGSKLADEIEDVDHRLAMKSIEWIMSDKRDGEYMDSLRKACTSNHISSHDGENYFMVLNTDIPLVASLPKSFQMNLSSDTEQGGFTGQVGQECNQMLKLISVISTQFSDLYKFTNDNGEELIWFTNTNPMMTEGELYRCRFKVKGHDEYNGVKQTKVHYLTIIT